MLSLAALRYRNVLAENGGPVTRIDRGTIDVRGRPLALANAYLTPGLLPDMRQTIYANAAGTGMHALPAVARYMAISESLERWAFHATVGSGRAAEFGFDADPSTNGMAAFPGLLRRSARRRALLEAVERFSLIGWWEGALEGRCFDTDWPGVAAVAINGPFGGVTAVVYARTEQGAYIYGHAAEESFGAACERALGELARHERVLRSWSMAFAAGEKRRPVELFERRCLFFSSAEGHARFLERVKRRAWRPAPMVCVTCDRDIPGPWANYATVWRFGLRPPTEGFFREDERYFFW